MARSTLDNEIHEDQPPRRNNAQVFDRFHHLLIHPVYSHYSSLTFNYVYYHRHSLFLELRQETLLLICQPPPPLAFYHRKPFVTLPYNGVLIGSLDEALAPRSKVTDWEIICTSTVFGMDGFESVLSIDAFILQQSFI